jgi:hypothetical protein
MMELQYWYVTHDIRQKTKREEQMASLESHLS